MIVSKKARYDFAKKLLDVDFLNEREKDIMIIRLGLNGNEPGTLQGIGEKYNISRERVRQIGTAIIRKAKKHLPEEKTIANKLFVKAWEPKYLVKERRVNRRRSAIKRNKTLIKYKCKKLANMINEFSTTRDGKDNIKKLFKELRIKYRKNKSLFEPALVNEIKSLRQTFSLARKNKISKTDVPAFSDMQSEASE